MAKMTRIEPRSQQENPLVQAYPWATVVALGALGLEEVAVVCFGIAHAGPQYVLQRLRKLLDKWLP